MSASVIAISLQKGGVGKTTTAINLGAALAELGFRTLIIDLDPQGNASSGLGVHPPEDAPTIAEVLRREETLDNIVEPTAEKNLFVAPAPSGQMLAEVEAQLVAEMFPQPRPRPTHGERVHGGRFRVGAGAMPVLRTGGSA